MADSTHPLSAAGTRDYLKAKWQANFPNTGFWTYIKYTIVEQHVYSNSLSELAWKDQAALVFGFFQMAGFNRYQTGKGGKSEKIDFLDVLQRLDKGWVPKGGAVSAMRKLERPAVTKTRPSYVTHLEEILPYGEESDIGCNFENEYMPFALAELRLASCAHLSEAANATCSIVVENPDSCSCWFNMPTFKTNSLLIRAIAKAAALVKIPSRVTTFVEMALSASRNGTDHAQPLRAVEGEAFRIFTCDVAQEDCSTSFSFTKESKLKLWRGAPPTVEDTLRAVSA